MFQNIPYHNILSILENSMQEHLFLFLRISYPLTLFMFQITTESNEQCKPNI